MALRFRLEGTDAKVGDTLRRKFTDRQGRTTAAAVAAITEAKERILIAGRDDMRAGGNFGSQRWQTSLQGDIEGTGDRLILSISHRVPFWRVFEFGATIRPTKQDRLWIPLRPELKGIWPRDFPGKLFRITSRKGKDLLMNASGPQYVGVLQVRLKRRFHLRPIIRRVAKQMPFLFKKWMRLSRGR